MQGKKNHKRGIIITFNIDNNMMMYNVKNTQNENGYAYNKRLTLTSSVITCNLE